MHSDDSESATSLQYLLSRSLSQMPPAKFGHIWRNLAKFDVQMGWIWPELAKFGAFLLSRALSLSLSPLRLILSTPLHSLLRFRNASIRVSSRSFLLVDFFSPSGFFSGHCFGNVVAVLVVVDFFPFFRGGAFLVFFFLLFSSEVEERRGEEGNGGDCGM